VAVILAIGGFAYKGAKHIDSRSSNPSGPKYLFSSQIKSSPKKTMSHFTKPLKENNTKKYLKVFPPDNTTINNKNISKHVR